MQTAVSFGATHFVNPTLSLLDTGLILKCYVDASYLKYPDSGDIGSI